MEKRNLTQGMHDMLSKTKSKFMIMINFNTNSSNTIKIQMPGIVGMLLTVETPFLDR
jgi:hypothetical protein